MANNKRPYDLFIAKEFATIDANFKEGRRPACDIVRNVLRSQPEYIDESGIRWLDGRSDEDGADVFKLFLQIGDALPPQRALLSQLCFARISRAPAAMLEVAGWELYRSPGILDALWISQARTHYAENPRSAWAVVDVAAASIPAAITDDDLTWFEARAADAPEEYMRLMFSVARADESRRASCMARALSRAEKYPAELIDVVRKGLSRHPDDAWKFFAEQAMVGRVDESLLDTLETSMGTGAESYFSILHRLALAEPGRSPALIARFIRGIVSFPKEAIGAAFYIAVNNPELLTPALLDGVAAHFGANAYAAYDIFASTLNWRPEMIHPSHVAAAAANIKKATNWAFGFFKILLNKRPEFTALGTLAIFECLAHEPVNRAPIRAEELQEIILIAQLSHVKTQLASSLREPPTVGSRRARALMAILFRQKLRAKQTVLFEALRLVSTATLIHGNRGTPLWDFFIYLLEESPDKAIVTAAAERFLEGAFQLAYIMENGAQHDDFRSKFTLDDIPSASWPPATAFLARDPELDRLYAVVSEVARRCGDKVKAAPLTDFLERVPRAQSELESIRAQLTAAVGERRNRLEKRRQALESRLAFWRTGKIGDDREIRGLIDSVRDSLGAELGRICVAYVEHARQAQYQAKAEGILGHPIDITKVDSSILPAFLFVPAVAGTLNTRKHFAHLIEDRLLGRPHDWLWQEAPVVAWKNRVAAVQPQIKFERWRAPYKKEYEYSPGDAGREKARRIKDDLAQTRKLLESQGISGFKDQSYEELFKAFQELTTPKPDKKDDASRPDPVVLEEIRLNLERVDLVSRTPESDYQGRVTLEVESDPFQILFMGEYGFASCLSLRGAYVWGAVSNAVDPDKTIVWARESGTNVIGRRLIVLTPDGILSYRTYANRNGFSLDKKFDDFLKEYAEYCGTIVTHHGRPQALLSDRWYDDGAI